MRIAAALANGAGGLDWSGFALWCDLYDITADERPLMAQRLATIKAHASRE